MIVLIGNEVKYSPVSGSPVTIKSPWSHEGCPISLTRVMDGDYIYLWSHENADGWMIDFISLRGFSLMARWYLDSEGSYIRQELLNVSRIGPLSKQIAPISVNSTQNIVEAARNTANDWQIYSFLKYIMLAGDDAERYIDGFAPKEIVTNSSIGTDVRKIAVSFVFNHNYARNIPKLEEAYSGRFSEIRYVMPNVSPTSERCFSFPVGSFSFHTMIFHLIDQLKSRQLIEHDTLYLFAHDDVYLNRGFDEKSIERYLGPELNASSFYYLDIFKQSWHFDADWAWNPRVLGSLEKQRDVLLGNGFEGLSAFYDRELLIVGTADIFFVKGEYLELFADILGSYISQNVFPEIAIPSALKAVALMTQTISGVFAGDYLWGDERSVVSADYVRGFDGTTKLFLHPVKSEIMLAALK